MRVIIFGSCVMFVLGIFVAIPAAALILAKP